MFKSKKKKNCTLFVPTNGAGLGHLTRCLAIAKRLKRLDPNREIIFFSTSAAMNLILQEGFLGYHLPSKMVCPEYVEPGEWNSMFQEHLRMIIKLHQPNLLFFDGVYPYAGLITSMRETKGMKKVWMRRGLGKNVRPEVDKKEKEFDMIIVPKELFIPQEEQKAGKHYYSDPIIYLEKSELLSREILRKKWKVPENHKLVFISLGAGNINDINPTISNILTALRKRKDIFIVVSESIIGKKLQIPEQENLIIIRDYPISSYYNAFDLAITASGYNSFHELLFFNVPAIIIPNQMTKTDNQVARALSAEKAGAAIVIKNESILEIERAINMVLEPQRQLLMRNTTQKLMYKNGADNVARLLKNFF
ncbi:glycosyltransferase [Priestia megaterium]|uniref:glycosyltransferase n=1 Tax=Priestia megaterium TaxID=1404 RepID=UPI00249CC085|nr:glycosyltransferase [Priestia megaterium]MDI3089731.1 glycosyltransferase [Priestia megaterium]